MHHAIVAGFFVAAYMGFVLGVHLGALLLLLTGASFCVLIFCEWLWPRRSDSNIFLDTQVRNDIGHFMLAIIMRAGIYALGILPIMAVGVDGAVATWSYVAQFALGLFVINIPTYFRHRLMHVSKFFWPMHELHHDTPQFHTLKAVRTHFLDELTSDITDTLTSVAVALVLGLPSHIYFAVSVWGLVFGNLIHANIDQKNPEWLHYIIPTVQLHEGHHAPDSMMYNLAGSLPLLDMLFGTYLHPRDMNVVRLGLDEKLPETFTGQLVRPFQKILHRPSS